MDFKLDSLRGGLDDFTPPNATPRDACRVAENVELFYSTLGERRLGCRAYSPLPGGMTTDGLLDGAVWSARHRPDDNPLHDELWVMTRDTDNVGKLYRLASDGWHQVTMGDAPNLVGDYAFRIYGQSLHGKFFVAYKSGVDRLHVWDGTTFRRVGISNTATIASVADEGGGAYPATKTYYRVRYLIMSGSQVLVRSEPTASVNITPSGAGAGVRVTINTLPGETVTHWELEASLDDATYYILAKTAIGTLFYDNTTLQTAFSTFPQSDPVNTYGTVPSVQYLAADEDRLLLGGSFETAADGSAIRWTPVGNDPSPGPDERLNLTTDPRIDLDGLDGGSLSGLSRVVNGQLMAFKREQGIYQILRTQQLVGAYSGSKMTSARGALPRSIIEANDEAGRPALYWLDPNVGPMRYGSNGLEFVGYDVTNTWKTVGSLTATHPCHGLFYASKYQVHWWVAVSGSATPNAKIIVHTNLMKPDYAHGPRGGWVTVPAPCLIANAYSSVMFATDITTGNTVAVPFIGKATWVSNGLQQFTVLQRCDQYDDDANDSGGDPNAAYTARIRSRGFQLSGILNQSELRQGAILATAVNGGTVDVRIVKNYGTETVTRTASLTPTVAEEFVVAQLDSLSLAELTTVEIEIRDTAGAPSPTRWRVHEFSGAPTAGQSA